MLLHDGLDSSKAKLRPRSLVALISITRCFVDTHNNVGQQPLQQQRVQLVSRQQIVQTLMTQESVYFQAINGRSDLCMVREVRRHTGTRCRKSTHIRLLVLNVLPSNLTQLSL